MRWQGKPRLSFALGLVVVLWLGGTTAAMAALWQYKTTPGLVGVAQSQWPAGTTLVRSAERPVLLMFAHPMCPCTRASIAELRVLMSRFAGKLDAQVLYISPDGADDDWSPEDFRREVGTLRGVRVVEDRNGQEAHRFGAKTSGHVVLYGADGRLLFAGGITGARGHEGDNAGVDEISALIDGTRTAMSRTPVFGCGLEDPEEP